MENTQVTCYSVKEYCIWMLQDWQCNLANGKQLLCIWSWDCQWWASPWGLLRLCIGPRPARLQHQGPQEAPEGSCRQVACVSSALITLPLFLLHCFTITGHTVHVWGFALTPFAPMGIIMQTLYLLTGQSRTCSRMITSSLESTARMSQWQYSMLKLGPRSSMFSTNSLQNDQERANSSMFSATS